MFSHNIDVAVMNIDKDYMLIELAPSFPALTINDIWLLFDDEPILPTAVEDMSFGEGSIYKIIFFEPLTPYDTVEFRLVKDDFVSSTIKIYMCKTISHHTGVFHYTLPEDLSGKFSLSLMNVNGLNFNLKSDEITVSPPIDISRSYVKLKGNGTSLPHERIEIDVKLIDENGNLVPDGIYLIEIELE